MTDADIDYSDIPPVVAFPQKKDITVDSKTIVKIIDQNSRRKMDEQDIDDLKTDIGRAFKAAIFSTDYWILRTILDTSKELKSAYEKNNFQIMNYILNKGFWDIGLCINSKLNNYSSVMPEFFDDISVNINNYFKTERNISYSPENLKRCLKLVNIASESLFENVARKYSWQCIADALDQSNCFDELQKNCISRLNEEIDIGLKQLKKGQLIPAKESYNRLKNKISKKSKLK